jgi:hypothetical protein
MKTVDVMALNQLTAFTVHLKIEKNLFFIYKLAYWLLAFIFGGGYRSRTDDPLRARQML